MKKIFLIFSLVFSISYSRSQVQYTSEDLIQNEDLQSYIIETIRFSQLLQNNLSSEELGGLNNFFTEAQSNNYSYEEQLELITSKFKISDGNIFLTHIEKLRISLEKINERFGVPINELNQDTLKYASSQIVSTQSNSIACEHPWRFSLCYGGKVIEGGVLLSGCLAMAGASAGVLTPASVACVAGVTAWLANEMQGCIKTWCNPT